MSHEVHIFWKGHKILRNLHQSFFLCTASQIIGGDFTKFCGLLRIYELYIGTKVGFWTSLIWLYLFAVYIVTHNVSHKCWRNVEISTIIVQYHDEYFCNTFKALYGSKIQYFNIPSTFVTPLVSHNHKWKNLLSFRVQEHFIKIYQEKALKK